MSLNLRAYFGPGGTQIEDLAGLIASHKPDVMLLEEARPGWLDVVCRAARLSGAYSLDVGAQLTGRLGDGCAIAVRPPLRIERVWRLEHGAFEPAVVASAIHEPVPDGYEVMPAALAVRFSTRTLLAEVSDGERRCVAAAFHATPGTSRVGGELVSEWKPFFHGAAAVALAELDVPFVFAIDANEPRAETLDSVRFHWDHERPGAAKFRALLGRSRPHRARDLQRELMTRTGRRAGGGRISDAYLYNQRRQEHRGRRSEV